jgi:hypothetical protein
MITPSSIVDSLPMLVHGGSSTVAGIGQATPICTPFPIVTFCPIRTLACLPQEERFSPFSADLFLSNL